MNVLSLSLPESYQSTRLSGAFFDIQGILLATGDLIENFNWVFKVWSSNIRPNVQSSLSIVKLLNVANPNALWWSNAKFGFSLSWRSFHLSRFGHYRDYGESLTIVKSFHWNHLGISFLALALIRTNLRHAPGVAIPHVFQVERVSTCRSAWSDSCASSYPSCYPACYL